MLTLTRLALPLEKVIERNVPLLLSSAVSGSEIVGLYGETLEIPCNNGAIKADDVLLTKWKYVSHSRGQ